MTTATKTAQPFTISDRTLVHRGSEKGVLSTTHLEEVRDYLAKLNRLQDPVDHERTLDQLHVDFSQGHMEAFWLGPDGREPTTFLLTDTGASQLQSYVLPGHFFKGLKQLSKMDEHGSKLSTMVWAKFARQQSSPPRKLRTVRMKVNGEIERVVRATVSQTYATYSNLEFVQDILDNAGEYANLPVLDWRVTDSGMRIRFAGMDNALYGLANLDQEALLNEPIPMIEAWNSEVARRKVGLRGGMWKLVCTNGMGHWNSQTEYNWIHRGDAERIRTGVQNAFSNLTTSASGVIKVYKEALDITIDNAFLWLEQELGLVPSVPDRVTKAAQAGLSDVTTTPGGVLASVVDAITLVAQDEKDMFVQYEVERAAARLLAKGRGISLKNGGNIPLNA
jgi:hypothetical protein